MQLMSDEAWRRHANPWSVYTRFAAIPAMILAAWSRSWLGGWAVPLVLLVLVWLAVNPIAFRPIDVPTSWAARGVFGERQWLRERSSIPKADRSVLNWLIAAGVTGLALLGWGLVRLEVWPTVVGAVVVVVAQLARIDRMGRLYVEHGGSAQRGRQP